MGDEKERMERQKREGKEREGEREEERGREGERRKGRQGLGAHENRWSGVQQHKRHQKPKTASALGGLPHSLHRDGHANAFTQGGHPRTVCGVKGNTVGGLQHPRADVALKGARGPEHHHGLGRAVTNIHLQVAGREAEKGGGGGGGGGSVRGM